jgi:hypothetical protein
MVSVLWHEHAGNYEVPPLDFSKEMVIALFAGRRDAEAAVERMSRVRAVRWSSAIVCTERRRREPPRTPRRRS